MILPCVECKGGCCRRQGQGWLSASIYDDGSPIPYDDNGDCIHLTPAGRCALHGPSKPKHCARFDCSIDEGFLQRRPEVRALLTVHGVAA